jgi:hypothetical protein
VRADEVMVFSIKGRLMSWRIACAALPIRHDDMQCALAFFPPARLALSLRTNALCQ